jgi:hypothetical protein
MDVNWYAWEKMVDEVLRTQRAKAEMARHAATAWRHPTRRLIGTLLIRLGRTLLGGSRGTRHDASVAVRAPGA